MMIVAAASHAGVRCEEGELAGILRLQHLDEDTARVTVLRHRVTELFRWQVADVSRVERSRESGADTFRDEGATALAERPQLLRQISDCDRVARLHLAVGPLRTTAGHDLYKRRDKVIDVDDLHRICRIVD